MIKDKLAPTDPTKHQYLVPWELTVTQDKLFIETIDLEAGSTRPRIKAGLKRIDSTFVILNATCFYL